jgi:hypothetical protein
METEPVYRAIKLLTPEQYEKIASGETALPEGVSLEGAKQGATVKFRDKHESDSSWYTTVFRGVGFSALFRFHEIQCAASVLIM